jgi:hypothetical protein
MKNKLGIYVMVISSLLVLLAGCNKSGSEENAVLQVMLTDAPADYQQVLIDIQDVQIHASENENDGEWVSLDVNSGVYNLLDFRNGMDTLLATIELPAGQISQMRLILGDNNQVKVDGSLYDLETPSAQQSGLKFNIHAALTGGIVYKLWIDFDAALSVVEKGNGNYGLKPVIRTYTEAVSGAISGTVSPAAALPSVLATSGGDTLSSYADDAGNYLIKGVPAGAWLVVLDPVDPFLSDTIDNVLVENGTVTVIDTVFFSQP